MPFVCGICDARLSRLCHLRGHIRRIHPTADIIKLLDGLSDKYEYVCQAINDEHKRRQDLGITIDDFKDLYVRIRKNRGKKGQWKSEPKKNGKRKRKKKWSESDTSDDESDRDWK